MRPKLNVMKNNYALLAILSFFIVISCQPDTVTEAVQQADQDSLDELIFNTIRSTDQPFDWNTVSDEIFWQALTLTDNIVVLGYGDGVTNDLSLKEQALARVRELEGQDVVPVYEDDVLGYMAVKISRMETLKEIRKLPLTFTEVNGYPIAMEKFGKYIVTEDDVTGPAYRANQGQFTPDMILDPFQEDPDYVHQVYAYDPSFGTIIRRHKADSVYIQHHIFGEDIDVAIIDNGIVDWAQELFETNGYGGRTELGFYNPLWFIPGTQPDGIHPQSYDVFGISEALEPQWLHGSGMVQSVLILAPNANITIARGSTAIIILFPGQILGIANAFRHFADQPEVKVVSMSMGTIFYAHRIANAINYVYSKGKIITCAAGTSFEEIKDLLGIIFPANLANTVSVTGIDNRENTGGAFVAGSTAHTGPENDFCVEKSAASSEATARMAGMFALIWSADPTLTREEVMDIAISSSYFYHLQGMKDPDFGWGTVDVLEAVEKAMP